MVTINAWEIAARLTISAILGGLIGLERESHGHPAGLRTHILVSLGSCLIMLISIYGFTGTHDPARLAAQVVSGIGFLGAGTIMREGVTVKGLTTAASLWVVAGIGLAIGDGFYWSGLLVTIFSVITLVFLEPIEKRFFVTKTYEIKVFIDNLGAQNLPLNLLSILPGVQIKHIELAMDDEKKEAVLDILVSAKGLEKDNVIASFAKYDGVKRVILK